MTAQPNPTESVDWLYDLTEGNGADRSAHPTSVRAPSLARTLGCDGNKAAGISPHPGFIDVYDPTLEVLKYGYGTATSPGKINRVFGFTLRRDSTGQDSFSGFITKQEPSIVGGTDGTWIVWWRQTEGGTLKKLTFKTGLTQDEVSAISSISFAGTRIFVFSEGYTPIVLTYDNTTDGWNVGQLSSIIPDFIHFNPTTVPGTPSKTFPVGRDITNAVDPEGPDFWRGSFACTQDLATVAAALIAGSNPAVRPRAMLARFTGQSREPGNLTAAPAATSCSYYPARRLDTTVASVFSITPTGIGTGLTHIDDLADILGSTFRAAYVTNTTNGYLTSNAAAPTTRTLYPAAATLNSNDRATNAGSRFRGAWNVWQPGSVNRTGTDTRSVDNNIATFRYGPVNNELTSPSIPGMLGVAARNSTTRGREVVTAPVFWVAIRFYNSTTGLSTNFAFSEQRYCLEVGNDLISEEFGLRQIDSSGLYLPTNPTQIITWTGGIGYSSFSPNASNATTGFVDSLAGQAIAAPAATVAVWNIDASLASDYIKAPGVSHWAAVNTTSKALALWNWPFEFPIHPADYGYGVWIGIHANPAEWTHAEIWVSRSDTPNSASWYLDHTLPLTTGSQGPASQATTNRTYGTVLRRDVGMPGTTSLSAITSSTVELNLNGGASAIFIGQLYIGTSEASTNYPGAGVIRWSQQTPPRDLDTFISNEVYALSRPGERVIRFARTGSTLIAFSNFSQYRIVNSGGAPTINPINEGYGICGAAAACEVGNTCYFMTNRGLHVLDNSGRIIDITIVNDIIQRDWKQSDFSKIQLAYDAFERVVTIFNPEVSGGHIVQLHLATQRITEHLNTDIAGICNASVLTNPAVTTSRLRSATIFVRNGALIDTSSNAHRVFAPSFVDVEGKKISNGSGYGLHQRHDIPATVTVTTAISSGTSITLSSLSGTLGTKKLLTSGGYRLHILNGPGRGRSILITGVRGQTGGWTQWDLDSTASTAFFAGAKTDGGNGLSVGAILAISPVKMEVTGCMVPLTGDEALTSTKQDTFRLRNVSGAQASFLGVAGSGISTTDGPHWEFTVLGSDGTTPLSPASQPLTVQKTKPSATITDGPGECAAFIGTTTDTTNRNGRQKAVLFPHFVAYPPDLTYTLVGLRVIGSIKGSNRQTRAREV